MRYIQNIMKQSHNKLGSKSKFAVEKNCMKITYNHLLSLNPCSPRKYLSPH